MANLRSILGGAAVTAAVVPLVLAGTGIAGAMGGAMPSAVYFTTTSDSVVAHIDAGNGITNCALYVMGDTPDATGNSEFTSDTVITVPMSPGSYDATLNCLLPETGDEWHVARHERVNVPPSLIDQLIDLLETGSS